jgi:hypothetical protein
MLLLPAAGPAIAAGDMTRERNVTNGRVLHV